MYSVSIYEVILLAIQYSLENNMIQPKFAFMVQVDGDTSEYWLYNSVDFDEAYNKMKSLSLLTHRRVSLYEPYFVTNTREWRMRRIFTSTPEMVKYSGDSGDILLHAKFYMDAGEWQNPSSLVF